ncbi:MAG: aminoglycoside phosphotransferase family protein [Bacteroidota bacterium]
MDKKSIQEIGKKQLGGIPLEISRKTIGLCNEVYELTYESESFILRMNKAKEWIYGTHQFLPIFKELHINTPDIVAADYSKTAFPFCYQIQTKLQGQDLGLVIDSLSPANLKAIAADISNIFDKFSSLPPKEDFGGLSGMNEEKVGNLLEVISNQRRGILERNETSNVLGREIIAILNELIHDYKEYFSTAQPKLYYDDISAKNVMIHNGRFVGLVDLDFLRKGDYLEALGAIMACWHGEEYGDIYLNEIIALQGLNEYQQNIIKVYAILHLMMWTTEEGIKFNSNSSGTINWENVEKKKTKIMNVYSSIHRSGGR